jgi:hypothetical protein
MPGVRSSYFGIALDDGKLVNGYRRELKRSETEIALRLFSSGRAGCERAAQSKKAAAGFLTGGQVV